MTTSKIIFASDFAPIRNFADMMRDEPGKVYGDLLGPLREADYRIVNLEAPLYTGDRHITKSGAAFSGNPEHVGSLLAGGFKTAICANNHTFDSDAEGFFRTRQLLENNGIACVGAGDNLAQARQPQEITVNGVKILLLAISEGEDMRGATESTPGVRPWEPEVLAEQIRQAKGKYNAVIVSAHCGLENQPFPSFYVYEAFRLWAEAGADIIVGHHPHVPQGMVKFGKCPAYFSLGNFAFYQPAQLFYRKLGYMLEMQIDETGIVSHRPIPYKIREDGLRLLDAKEQADFNELMGKLSAPLQSEAGAHQAWNAVLAYNGVQGFCDELEKIRQTMLDDAPKGAAMLRNRVCCMQHRMQWIDGMNRIADGTIDDAPAELVELVRDFLKREVGK
ncbi:MAG: CapA family protein [Victivallales bacterium]|nr:CapA family protein [Victivallales bacterium]